MQKNMSKFYMRLLSVCLAALVLAACSSSEGGGDDGPTAGQIPDKAGMTVKGIVKDSAGNGIAGVVVSDGLEVTATDERGIYYLASDLARRNFVFVSVPADCEIPATQGCPRFYRKIDRKQAVNRADFTLTRRKTPSDRHSLIVMADIQLAADNTSVDSYLGHVVPDVLKTVQGLPTEVYGVSLGDLVWNDMSLFPKYRQGLETLGFTTFSLPGNHDHDPAELTDSLALQSYERYFGPANYSVNIGKIICSSTTSFSTMRRPPGRSIRSVLRTKFAVGSKPICATFRRAARSSSRPIARFSITRRTPQRATTAISSVSSMR